jgi:hypothetical protein
MLAFIFTDFIVPLWTTAKKSFQSNFKQCKNHVYMMDCNSYDCEFDLFGNPIE